MEAGVLSLGYSILFGLLLSEGKTFLFFQMVLSILGSQSYLGCCYQKVEPSLFFSPGSVSLGWSILFGLLLSEGKTFSFFFFHMSLSLLGSQSYLGCCYLKAEPSLFFLPGSPSVEWSVLFWSVLFVVHFPNVQQKYNMILSRL